MRRMYFMVGLFLMATALKGQSFSFTEMVDLSNLSDAKFNSYINKKGFRQAEQENDFIKYSYQGTTSGNDSIEHYIRKYSSKTKSILCFDKLTSNEYAGLIQKIKQEDFIEGRLKGAEDTILFQKNNFTIYIIKDTETSKNTAYYDLIIEKGFLPKPKDIHFAEDLLAFNSHEHIAAVFGQENVVKDVFIGPDGQEVICSVLFPNSSHEAVFLWNDGANYRTIRAIRIGGYAHTKGAMTYTRPVEQSSWLSNQGIYVGMSLKELDFKNGNEIDFYGWDWNSGGTLTKNNNGKIDFGKISLVLSCFNCTDADYQPNKVNSSTVALKEDKKIHVATMVVLPVKE